MDSPLDVDFSDSLTRTAHDLASLSGVDLTNARQATIRLWEARGLALHALVRGDIEEATRIMAHAKGRSRNTKPAALDAAKEQ